MADSSCVIMVSVRKRFSLHNFGYVSRLAIEKLPGLESDTGESTNEGITG